MEKKQINTYSGISKSVLDRLNRNFFSEPIKDFNVIDEIMSEFITGELNTIENILSSNKMLNFKDQMNQTLIHAILRNESINLTEAKKLMIIQNLVNNKNVSIHTMTNLNQNPLHLACQKGYVSIIEYLIEKGCDQNLIDNYGNAPSHYLVDKFIRECNDNDFYSQKNKEIKLLSSMDLNKINNILKNQSILILYKLLTINEDDYYSKDIGLSGVKIINALRKFISNKLQLLLPIINDLIKNKENDITKIFLEFRDTTETKFEKSKKIIFDIDNEVKKILEVNLEFQNIIMDDFISSQINILIEEKEKIKKNILYSIKQINKIFENIKINIQNEFIIKKYCILYKFGAGVFLIYHFIDEFLDQKEYNIKEKNIKILFSSNNDKGNIFSKFKLNEPITLEINSDDENFKINKEKLNILLNELFKKDLKVFLNSEETNFFLNYMNAIDCNFEIDEKYNYEFFHFRHKKKSKKCFSIYKKIKKLNEQDYYNVLILNVIESENKIYENLLKNISDYKEDIIDENYIMENQQKKNKNKYFIFSPIRILIDLINHFIKIIIYSINNLYSKKEEELTNNLLKFILFDVKYLSEIILKIINNLILLEKYFDDIDIKNISTMNSKFKQIYNNFKISNNEDFKKIIKLFDFIIEQTLVSDEFIEDFKSENYKDDFKDIYNKLIAVIDIFKTMTNDIAKYFSVDQFNKYSEFLNDNIKKKNITITKKINNTIFNNYSYKINLPIEYTQYKENYFQIKKNINLFDKGQNFENNKNNLKLNNFIVNQNYKKYLIENIFPYINTFNFNIFYIDKENKNLNYYTVNTIEKGSIIKLNDFNITLHNYKLDNYGNKFLRGYDMLSHNANNKEVNNLNIYGIQEKKEVKTLCNMKFIKEYSDFTMIDDEASSSIKENTNKIVSWPIKNELEINNIDKVDSYLITNNLNGLIKVLVYTIYEKIKSSNISDVFFDSKNLEFINIKNKSEIKEKLIGVDFENYKLDEISKNNIIETLGIIKINNETRQKYLLDNIIIFVKIILFEEINKIIFKIMDEIKITNISKDRTKEERQNILSLDTINKFNKEFEVKYDELKKNFWNKELAEYIKSLHTSSTLDFQEILNLSGINIKIDDFEQNKIIDSKCLNSKKTDKLLKISNLDLKVLDSNGNSILIRLIEQFNIYGIEKILNSRPVLSTYKNNNMETPLDYLSSLITNIQTDYSDSNFKKRISHYSVVLENTIKSSKNFEGIELENSEDLFEHIICNSIYLFNEILWIKIYSYPNGWTSMDKNNLKSILGFKEEKLLINSFDSKDVENYIEKIKYIGENKILSYITILEKEIEELKNRSKELQIETDDDIIKHSEIDITDEINKLNNNIKEKENIIKNYNELLEKIKKEKYDDITKDIINIFDKFKDNLLDVKNLSIRWIEYKKLLEELNDKYFKIISILDKKCDKTPLISNYIIKILNIKILNNEPNETISKYLKLIFTPIFNDYWDLDRYDNSEYNTTHNSILWILKINVIEIITNELINSLKNYFIQINKNKEGIESIIKNMKNDKDLKTSIEIYLYNSLINKLGLLNPDKTNLQINIDEQKNIIINILNKRLLGKIEQTDKEEIIKILEFNKFICENIGFNCYEEIIKILYDGKKISLYYEIYNIINKSIN